MNKLHFIAYPLVALASLLSSGIALADDPTPDNLSTVVFAQTKTRAQVVAEYHQARADGSMKVMSSSYNPLLTMKSTTSRAEVKATALASAPAADMYGEDSGSFALSRTPGSRSAGPVYAAAPRIVK